MHGSRKYTYSFSTLAHNKLHVLENEPFYVFSYFLTFSVPSLNQECSVTGIHTQHLQNKSSMSTTGCRPTPSSTCSDGIVGKKPFERVNYPPSPHWDRRAIQPKSVFRIHNIFGWIRIRIRGSMPLTNGSGSCYFRHWPSRCQQKTNFLTHFFLLITFWRYIYIIFQR